MATARNTLKNWFSRGKKPTGQQFSDLIDSFWHKDEVNNGTSKIWGGNIDPRNIPGNYVKNLDKWIPDTLVEYTLIGVDWVALTGSGSGGTGSQPSIFTVDTFRFNNNKKTIIRVNGDKNFILKSK